MHQLPSSRIRRIGLCAQVPFVRASALVLGGRCGLNVRVGELVAQGLQRHGPGLPQGRGAEEEDG